MLIVAGILLAIVLLVAVFSILLARTVSEQVAQRQLQPSSDVATSTPTPKERSVYLDLPESFPRDFPLLLRSKITVSNESKDDWTGVFLTVASVEEARDFYRDELAKAGWSITDQSQGGGLSIIYAQKDVREAIVAIGRGEGGTTVSVTILKGL